MKSYLSIIFILTALTTQCSMHEYIHNLATPFVFSDTTHNIVLETITDIIKGENEIPNPTNNGILKIYKSMQQQLLKEPLNNWVNKEENQQAKKMYLETVQSLLNADTFMTSVYVYSRPTQIVKSLFVAEFKLSLVKKIIDIFEEQTPIRWTKKPPIGSINYWLEVTTNTLTNMIWSTKEQKKIDYELLEHKEHLIANHNLNVAQYTPYVISHLLCISDILQRIPDPTEIE